MKEKFVKSIFFLSFIFIAYSCSQDDDLEVELNNNGLFTIHASEIQGFSGDRYIMATSPLTGDVLYWDAMTGFQDSITFDANGSETVDLTYAYEFGSHFGIRTYRDIKSEFKLSGFLYPCYEGHFSYDTLNGKSVDVIIPGTKEIVEFINPAYDSFELQETSNTIIDQQNKIVYDIDNNYTILNAKLQNASLDFQFTIRFSGEQEYKSIVIKKEDWIKVDDNNYKRELETENLILCNLYEIEVGIDDTWIVDSEVLTSNGDRIKLAQWSHYSQNQMGEKIKIFLQDDLEIDQLLIKVRGNNINKGIEFQKRFDNIPTSISLKEYISEVENLTSNTYSYSTNENFHIVKTSYKYLNSNSYNTWDVFQSSNSTSEYRLPLIESGFLDETTLIKGNLMNPSKFKMQFYTLETEVEQVYNETGIDRLLQCLNFNSSYESYDF